MSLMSGEMGRYQSFHPHPLNLGTVNILVFFSNSPFLREQYTARLLCKYFGFCTSFQRFSAVSTTCQNDEYPANIIPGFFPGWWSQFLERFLLVLLKPINILWFYWKRVSPIFNLNRTSGPTERWSLSFFHDPHLCRVVSYISWLVIISYSMSYSIFTQKS